MIVFVQSAPNRVAQAGSPDHLGDFLAPQRVVRPMDGLPWAADNDAFCGWSEERYVRMVRRIVRGVRCEGWSRPVFLTLPDVVADHEATMRRFHFWHRAIYCPEIPRAFVLQDGCERWGWRGVPWDYCEALFIGGSTEFKLSAFAREMVGWAKFKGMWVHMGRVNSVRRALYAREIGCDSIDGTGLTRFVRSKLLPVLAALDRESRQGRLL